MGALVSLLVTGVIAYAAVRKYRTGQGLAYAIGWFCWTVLWLGIVAVVAFEAFGTVGGIVVNLAYGLLRLYDITQEKRADEYFTSEYGSLTRYRVTYLGGHPAFRFTGVRGVLLITQAGLILVRKYRAQAETLCIIPIDRIRRAESMGATDRVLAWTNDMPVPITFTASEQGTLAVQFLNDLDDTSTATFRVGTGRLAAALKNQVDYAVYDWKRASMGGLQST